MHFKAEAFVFMLIVSGCLYGQNHPDTLYVRAQQQEQSGGFDQAYKLYEEASTLFLSQGDYGRFLQTRVAMAKATQFTSIADRGMIPEILSPVRDLVNEGSIPFSNPDLASYYIALGQYQRTITGNYPEAISNFDSAMVICDRIGPELDEQRLEILVERSQIFANQERFDQAIDDAKEGLHLAQKIHGKESATVGPRYYNLGFIYYRKGHFQTAENLIKEGIRILIENEGPPMQIALGYNNLSAIFVAQMDLKEAEENAIKFENIVGNILGPEHEAMGVINWDMGMLYLNLQRYDQAIEKLSNAITIFESRFGPEYQQLPDLYHQLGAAYDGIQDCDQADVYHKKGLALKEALFLGETAKRLESYRYLTQHYIDCALLSEAEIYLDKSIAFRDSLDANSLTYSWMQELEGSYYFSQDSFMQSATAQHHALWTLAEQDPHQSLDTNPPLESLYNILYAAESSMKKSKSLTRVWFESQDDKDLQVATSNVQYTDDLIDRLRSQYQDSESKIFLQQKARDHYETTLALATEALAQTGREEFLEMAWQTSEKSRSLVLMEALKSQPAESFNIAPELIQQQSDLRDDISFLESQMLEAQEYQDTATWQKALAEYTSKKYQLDALGQQIASDYPEYYEFTTSLAPIDLYSFQSQLATGDLFVEYFMGEDHAYRIQVSNDDLQLHQLGPLDTLHVHLDRWIALQQEINDILKDPEELIRQSDLHAEALYGYLFADMEEDLASAKNLIIVGDQKLGYLSFDALVNPGKNGLDRYLIFDHSIRYAYSGTQFAHMLDPFLFDDIAFAGFAPTYSNEETDLKNLLVSRLYRGGNFNLPGARAEVERIQEISGGEIFIDNNATEQAFKKNVSHYDVLHLSLHGVIDDEDPLFSKLVFAPTDTIDDGFLNVHEIYPLNLDADLVVLSACNTGQGKIEQGEGIMSLSRAFSYAGSPRMIASLWKADDVTTSDIMVKFYQEMDKGLSIHEALRQAKLSFLQDQKVETFRHPYFWSAFVLYDQQAALRKKIPILRILGTSLLLLAMIVLFVRQINDRKKKRKDS